MAKAKAEKSKAKSGGSAAKAAAKKDIKADSVKGVPSTSGCSRAGLRW